MVSEWGINESVIYDILSILLQDVYVFIISQRLFILLFTIIWLQDFFPEFQIFARVIMKWLSMQMFWVFTWEVMNFNMRLFFFIFDGMRAITQVILRFKLSYLLILDIYGIFLMVKSR